MLENMQRSAPTGVSKPATIPGRILAAYIVAAASLVFSSLVLLLWAKGVHPSWPQASPVASAILYAPIAAVVGLGLTLGSCQPSASRRLVLGSLVISLAAIGLAVGDWLYYASTIHR
jgi:uncharacterized membrane protein YedE/YeeE